MDQTEATPAATTVPDAPEVTLPTGNDGDAPAQDALFNADKPAAPVVVAAEETPSVTPPTPAVVAAPVEGDDWLTQAVKTDPSVRARFKEALLTPSAAAPPVVVVDPVQEAERALAELQQNPAKLDPTNATAEDFSAFYEYQEKRNQAQASVFQAKLEQQQQQLAPIKTTQSLNEYVTAASTAMPEFKSIEQDFRNYIRANNINPELVQNHVLMDTLAKSMLYDATRKQGAVTAPAPAVDEAYNQQGAAQRAATAKPQRAVSPQEAAVAEFLHVDKEELAGNKWGNIDRQDWDMGAAGMQFTDPAELRRSS